MNQTAKLRLGTRGSALARWQADWVARRLSELGTEVELIIIETTGDVTAGPIANLATQGVFTKQIQRSLLAGDIDLAVHSLKDLPTDRVDGLELAASPQREACGDALLAREVESFKDLPTGATVATGSLRRRAQLLALRPDLELVDVRGNIDTRISKLHEGEFDAMVLAEAGLRRLGREADITQVFDKTDFLPAVGQGALGLEIRADDEATRQQIQPLNDPDTFAAVTAERRMLANLRGGCLAPVAAWGRTDGPHRLVLEGLVASADGTRRIHARRFRPPSQADELGAEVAETLLEHGAAQILENARG